MTYFETIQALTREINSEVIDFSVERSKAHMPTQVSSEFLTNKEQGDWAEETLLRGINENSEKYIAVHYGKNDNVIAGEEGFEDFYSKYQEELDTIGKRPDLLIFDKKDFDLQTHDISNYPLEELAKIVPKAKCGIEVRSSSFLIDKYESYMNAKCSALTARALEIKRTIISTYAELLKSKNRVLYDLVESINEENMCVLSFRVPSWKSSSELSSLSNLLKELKSCMNEISKRTFLSITPKVEDLKVVYKWIETYNVPHFYVQMFFDKAYGISFESILELLGNPALEGNAFFLESDVKNQNKTTIKINPTRGKNILKKIEIPEHHSQMRELGKGRLLFYVKFKNSCSIINNEEFERLFGFKLE